MLLLSVFFSEEDFLLFFSSMSTFLAIDRDRLLVLTPSIRGLLSFNTISLDSLIVLLRERRRLLPLVESASFSSFCLFPSCILSVIFLLITLTPSNVSNLRSSDISFRKSMSSFLVLSGSLSSFNPFLLEFFEVKTISFSSFFASTTFPSSILSVSVSLTSASTGSDSIASRPLFSPFASISSLILSFLKLSYASSNLVKSALFSLGGSEAEDVRARQPIRTVDATDLN
mmetsp:Transcript_15347/g.23232  ORF Transcript_15347/g.23232 Transcript_15347/m.23232 type:complete len:229 (-) Transcript_15347:233-919(-)